MCHHYKGSRQPPEHLRNEFSLRANQHHLDFQDGSFYPLAQVPIIRLNHNGVREIVAAEWGLLPYWWKPTNTVPKRAAFQRRCFNAQNEGVDVRPAFRAAFKKRRCLLPAGEFFEKGHYFKFADDRMFAFAGLWESWRGGENEVVESCTLLTTEPNELVQSVGHHRMPVLLASEADWRLWLDPEIVGRGPLEHLFAPTDPALMTLRTA